MKNKILILLSFFILLSHNSYACGSDAECGNDEICNDSGKCVPDGRDWKTLKKDLVAKEKELKALKKDLTEKENSIVEFSIENIEVPKDAKSSDFDNSISHNKSVNNTICGILKVTSDRGSKQSFIAVGSGYMTVVFSKGGKVTSMSRFYAVKGQQYNFDAGSGGNIGFQCR